MTTGSRQGLVLSVQ